MAKKTNKPRRSADNPAYVTPLQIKKKHNRIYYVYIPLAIFFICALFRFYVDGLNNVPPWIAALSGQRDPLASDFDDISYVPEHEIVAAEDYADLSPTENNYGDNYMDNTATNDRYDGYTCDMTAKTDIIVMDITPNELKDRKQTIICVKLFNRGAAAENVKVMFTTEDGQKLGGTMPVVPSCSSQARFRWTPQREGEIKVTGLVNTDKHTVETEYTNNAKVVTIKVAVSDAPLVPNLESHDYVEWQEDDTGNIVKRQDTTTTTQ